MNNTVSNTITMKDLPAALEALVAIGEVPCLIGASGIGKTQVTGQVADKLDADFVPINLMTKDPVELGGLPVFDAKTNAVRWVPVSTFMKGKRRKWFFFDEITHATPVQQSMCYQIMEARQIGDHKLPDDCIISAAHNRVKDKGVHNRVPTPLRRRWFELQVIVDNSPEAVASWKG
jgi:MoxR-like ATPase